MSRNDKANILELRLHGWLVGHLVGFSDGRNVLHFAHDFKMYPDRPTFSLVTRPNFPNSSELMAKPWIKRQKLHPVLSNLLPEGALRELVAQGLKVHIDNEFLLLSYLGKDLPGAIIATPMAPKDVPEYLLNVHSDVQVMDFDADPTEKRFSLAGVQMKFSMREKNGRYNLTHGDEAEGELGDWIIKTPSTKHAYVPLNEYSAMSLAALVGVEVPEIKLVDLGKIDHLPQINLPNEKYAYAIKRFDRDKSNRIHMEDFAQVLVKYSHEKYRTANYEQIGKVIYRFSGDGLADAQQFARRLLVNILLGNGDAHLKNWSIVYHDKVTPRLSPAYDIVTTNVYIDGEKTFALNLGQTREWYQATFAHFEHWANKATIPWRVIEPHLHDVMNKARGLWPKALGELPMAKAHKKKLSMHWSALHKDFRI